MKKGFILVSVGMLAISVIVVGCSKDEDHDDFYSLDVSSRTPKNRSVWADGGASQTIGGMDNPYAIPKNESECMLYAIISIASSKRIPITCVTSAENGGYKQTTNTIGKGGFTAKKAYDYVKGLAMSQSWSPCDVYGNPIPNSDPYSYEGGAMSPSVAREIGKQSGILQGVSMYFSSYGDLQSYMKTSDFKENHHSGTYIICGESGAHAAIGKGVDKNGNVRYSDASHGNSKYGESEQKGGWTLIY